MTAGAGVDLQGIGRQRPERSDRFGPDQIIVSLGHERNPLARLKTELCFDNGNAMTTELDSAFVEVGGRYLLPVNPQRLVQGAASASTFRLSDSSCGGAGHGSDFERHEGKIGAPSGQRVGNWLPVKVCQLAIGFGITLSKKTDDGIDGFPPCLVICLG